MKPSRNTKVYHNPTSIFWFDEDGILCSVFKKAPVQSLKQVKKNLDDFKEIIGPRKVCMLLDISHSPESNRETREYTATELPKLTTAIAFISKSAVGVMLANLFFSLKPQPYPIKMFKDESKARKWLNKYL